MQIKTTCVFAERLGTSQACKAVINRVGITHMSGIGFQRERLLHPYTDLFHIQVCNSNRIADTDWLILAGSQLKDYSSSLS